MVRQLSTLYSGACEQLRTVGLSASVPEIARSAPGVVRRSPKHAAEYTDQIASTHEEIAEFIGTTRETVTRTLVNSRTAIWWRLQGSTLMISDRAARNHRRSLE